MAEPVLNAGETVAHPYGHMVMLALDNIIQSFQTQAECLEGQIPMSRDKYDKSSGVILPQLLCQCKAADLPRKINIQKINGRHRVLTLQFQQLRR